MTADVRGAEPEGGLRQRKKQHTRRLIAETALSLFLERGFDAVRVIEVARACDVSEKTVYNYFPTKEALVFDEDERLATELSTAISTSPSTPLTAVAALIERRTRDLLQRRASEPAGHGIAEARRFFDLVETTPSLRAHRRDSLDRLTFAAADALAERAGQAADDTAVQAVAIALTSLLRIQLTSLHRHTRRERSVRSVVELVIADVQRARDALAHIDSDSPDRSAARGASVSLAGS